jgi:hypothetical protein
MLDLTSWSSKILVWAEEFYLKTNNWIKLNNTEWTAPDDVDMGYGKFIRYNRQQAIAIQKQIADN